ncbi:hypothetical protein ACTQ54_02450 [Fundicoccus sp. Sow4_H7]|uniref:hypothetical protein n=1 Tax=Fundicoccus sp. Sow4_H7 TaxID=3438784 RepID=UPI003F8F6939
MEKKERLIELCRELRLPSIRKMVQEEGTFYNPTEAYTVLIQVLEQEKMTALFVQNNIEYV